MTLATDQIEVTVSYAYGAHPLIPAFPFLQDALMPASSVLSARPPCISATRWTEIPEPCGPQRLPPLIAMARVAQRGIAALEFSLTLTMLLMFICAVVGYGVLFWMQQQLAAAANESARRRVRALLGRARRERRGLYGGNGRVLDRLRGGLRHHRAPCAWSGAGGQTANCATISMTYNTQSWPVLATMQALIAMLPGTNKDWIPSRLSSKATVQISQGTP